MASETRETARNVAEKAQAKAQEVGNQVAQKADKAVSSVGQGMSSLGDRIRRNAPERSTTAQAVADRLEAGGRYLQEHQVEDLAEEVTGVIRRNPMQSLWIGVAAGLLLGAAFARRQ